MGSRNNRGGGLVRSLIGAGVLAALLVGAFIVGFKLLGSPFSTTEKDHSAPPILLELNNLSDYHAAQARLEVTLDIEKDVKWVPSFIAGERVQFVGVGTVDASVDFSALQGNAVAYNAETKSVTITLPHATMSEPVLDRTLSHVMNRDRGLVNRVGGLFVDNPTSEKALYDKTAQKLAEAAAQTDLIQRAEENTRAMLTTMLRSAGLTDVVVQFADGPPPATTTTAGGDRTPPTWLKP
ncbi:MAG TPA: DUF4230 domain-containing protein [Ilumatobacteraceae bacterium]|nr:DUF4230 domain-containing protein [Ilumatobacteraceae bacterium]